MELAENYFETIEKVCSKTFGPNGMAVLVQGSTGTMSVTQRGWTIVQSIYDESNLKSLPIKVFFNSMKEINKIYGDGVKSFALVEIAFLKRLMHLKVENSMSVVTISQELQSLLRAFCEMNILSPISVSLSKPEDRVRATSALFYTSCPSAVSSSLQTIFHDWVSSCLCINSCKNSDENFISYLQFLTGNFDLLCYRNNSNSKCVSDSYILPGYLVDRVALNLNSKKEEQLQVELYIPEEEVDVLDILFRIKLIIKEKSSSNNLRTLLLTTAVLTEVVLFELIQHNFVVLHGVPVEAAKFVSLILHQNIDILNNVVNVKSYITGTKECTCLLLPNIFQLIICAPTDSLISEYACICKNALKHLLVIAKSSHGAGLVQAGGIFEKSLHFYIAKQINKVRDPSLFLVSNRKELLEWHRQNQLMKTALAGQDSDGRARNQSVKGELNNSGQGVSEENGISNVQNTELTSLHLESKSQDPKQLRNIEKHWMNNLEINGLLLQNVNENILAAFAQSLLRICNSIMLTTPLMEVYEPVSFKMQLLHHVIITAILFFKCDIAK
ncbi:hypothetical protein R5R35_008378 [Gryllus longicercus]|uniref:Bardet-Biedl syndrome 10 protein n=1 Tax=Gryllus longicercus TaxID=2509291 RepID=A0AAN9VUX3_9ORTH